MIDYYLVMHILMGEMVRKVFCFLDILNLEKGVLD